MLLAEVAVGHPLMKYCIFFKGENVNNYVINPDLYSQRFCPSPPLLPPPHTAATGDIPAYQLRSPNSGLAQSIVMAASPGSMQSPSSQHAEEITRKREVRLMKNR